MELTAEEIRVLGCLVEKAATTPDQYPLSTNALTNACNQKTSRDPVVDYPERTVIETMLSLRANGLARTITGGRTEKHRHVLHEALDLDDDELALVGVLLLRGAQSAGELKARTERYPTSEGTGFGDPADVTSVLTRLAARDEPLVANVGRGPGQSQDRWRHLLGDDDQADPAVPADPTRSADAADPTTSPGGTPPLRHAGADDGPTLADRLADVERRLARLESALGVEPDDAI